MADRLAVLLLDYRERIQGHRLMLRSGIMKEFRHHGESDLAQQLQPPAELLDLVSRKHLAHDIPGSETLRTCLGSLNASLSIPGVIRQTRGEAPLDDRAIEHLI